MLYDLRRSMKEIAEYSIGNISQSETVCDSTKFCGKDEQFFESSITGRFTLRGALWSVNCVGGCTVIDAICTSERV